MSSLIRRKPIVTYKSPTAEDHAFIRSPSTKTRTTLEDTTPVPSSSRESPVASSSQSSRRRRSGYPLSPPLPLFHPFGSLAMSLPPLDPTQYGLPIPSVPDERDYTQITRSRRPAAKLPEPEEDPHVMVSSTVSDIAAVAARETKERASPRKRRAGGAKRRRKDAEDADPTYPAKRTRPSRGAPEQALEDDSPTELVVPTGVVTPDGGLSDTNDASKRRSGRAKGNLKRRDSSASETSTSQPTKTTAPNNTIVNDDKEEGELSEET